MTRVAIDPQHPDPNLLRRAAKILQRGGLVAFPTETVYGLGAHALNEDAVRGIFRAKGRPTHNPLIVHVVDAAAARELVTEWPDQAAALAEAFWPGPLTLVLPKQSHVPDVVTAGLATVALRVPAHPVAHALLRTAALPLAAPSANRSNRLSPTTALHVESSLGDRVDFILDAGPTRVGIESTVLDASSATPVLLRPGGLPVYEIERVIGLVVRPNVATSPDSAVPRRSPGMLDRHYAPRAELRLFSEPDAAAEDLRCAHVNGRRVGALVLHPIHGSIDHVIRMPSDPADYAQRLYAALHELDELGCDLILAERVPDEPAWDAIRDRLRRGAEPPRSRA